MNKKEDKKETSTSPKEKEKLRQRLKLLFAQQDNEAKPKKSTKSFQKKTADKHQPQQVNGASQSKPTKGSTQKIFKNKTAKEFNGLSNGGQKKSKHNENLSDMQRKQEGSKKGIPNKKRKPPKDKKQPEPPVARAVSTDPQKSHKKKNKSKQNIAKNIPKINEVQASSENTKPKVPIEAEGEKKLSKNQKRKARKRAAAEDSSVKHNIQNKKPKITEHQSKQGPKNANRSKKAKNLKKAEHSNKANKKLSHNHDIDGKEFDASSMPGLVKGGDFDHDPNEEDDYWKQQLKQDNYSQHSKSDINSCKAKKSKKEESSFITNKLNGETSIEDQNLSELGDDPYNYSDLDENDPYDYSDLSEGEEEDVENYSDFDEGDYEEDEDSYDYSSDSEYSSDYDENDDVDSLLDLDAEGDEDEDYKLPEHVPEDLVIHAGTATKRELLPEDGVKFKDKNYAQIVELKDQEAVKIIKQPKEYQKDELLKLTYKENRSVAYVSNKTENQKNECANESDECPKLVPIVGFQVHTSNQAEEDSDVIEENGFYDDDEIESLGSEYSEIDSEDADSLLSEDINDKYLNRGINEGDDISSDDENAYLAAQSKVDVIDATNCEYNGGNLAEDEDINMETEQPSLSHTLSKLVKVGSKVDVITTLVVDRKYLREEDGAKSANTVNIEQVCTAAQTEIKKPEMSLNTSIEEQSVGETQEIELSDAASVPFPQMAESKNQLQNTENTTIQTAENNNQSQNPANTAIQTADSKNQSQNPAIQSADSQNQSQNTTNFVKSSVQSMAEYNTVFCNAVNANLVLVLLKNPFYLYGTARLTLLAGSVEVYGHSLAKNKEVELFSPRGCSEIEISSKQTAAKEAISKEELKHILKNYESNFLKNDLEHIMNTCDTEKDAVVLLKRNEERKKIVQQFKKFMNENVFPNLQNITIDRPLYDTEYLLRCMINTSPTVHKSLRLPDQWQSFSVDIKSRVLIAGGKSVGKSTLLRFLVNKHISIFDKVLLIDLDIGQPELFVPQTVSCTILSKPLLGPGFFLNMQPMKSFAVGHTNIALCPHKYMAAVRSLIRFCRAQEEFQNVPWFVNTMGYNKGFGPELISIIVGDLPLTDIIQIQSNKAINNFESLLFPGVVTQIPRNIFAEDIANDEDNQQTINYRLHIWQSAVAQESRYQKEWYMSPKDMRYAIMLTRLSEALQGHAEWLSDCKPMSAPLDKLKLINLMDNMSSCSPEELAKAMEANLVYLCHYKDDLHSVECLGIGVVRAVDYHVQQLYLVPATATTSLLKRVNCLALGEMPLPSSLLTNQGSRVQKTAHFVYNTIEAKASKAIKQIYHRPSQFLTGKHKSLD